MNMKNKNLYACPLTDDVMKEVYGETLNDGFYELTIKDYDEQDKNFCRNADGSTLQHVHFFQTERRRLTSI